MPQPSAVFILNPTARRCPPRESLEQLIDAVVLERDLQPRIVETEAPGHATALAAWAADGGASYIFACGGDGTLNEVLNGLPEGCPAAVGVLPFGTVNVWARETGIPRQPLRALRAGLDGEVVPVDLGRAGSRRFLLMAGYGLDALAVAALRPGVKRWTGPFAYLLAGLEAGLRYGGFRAALRFDGEDTRVEVHAAMMVLANTRLYGGVAPIAPTASAVDGMLDCVVIQGVGIPSAVRVLPQALLGRHLRSDRVLYRRCRELQIEPLAGSALPPTQLDGDLGPVDASTVVVERAAVRMLVPNPAVPVLQTAPESA